MVIVVTHTGNLHGDGRKNGCVCVYFTVTAAHHISSCSCNKLESQAVISGWLNHHWNCCNPYKPFWHRNKNQLHQQEQRIQTAAGSSIVRNGWYQAPSQSSAASIPPFLEQNNSPAYSKQCSRPQRDSNLKWASQQDVHSERLVSVAGKWQESLREWSETLLSLLIRTLNSAHTRYFLFPIHHLPQYMLAQFLLLRCWAASPWEIWRDILNLSQPIWVWANLEPKLNATLMSVYLLRDLYAAGIH